MELQERPPLLFSFVCAMAWLIPQAFLFGCVYAIAVWLVPLLFFRVLLPLIALFIIGYRTAKAIESNAVHSTSLHWTASILVGLLALYGAWGTHAWIHVQDVTYQGYDPRILIYYVEFRHQFDKIEVEGDADDTTFRGTGLLTLWVIEAGFFTIGSALVCANTLKSMHVSFCRTCRGVRKIDSGLLRYGFPQDVYEFSPDFDAGDFSRLDELPSGTVEDDPHLRIDVDWCPACETDSTASVYIISYSSTLTERCLCLPAKISQETLNNLQARGQAQKEYLLEKEAETSTSYFEDGNQIIVGRDIQEDQ